MAAGIVLLLSAVPGNAAARRNLPGFNTNSFGGNDDSSTGQINLGFTINLFGTSFSSLYINNNGNVTFDAPSSSFTPFGLTGGGVPKILAPFFADVDTRSGNIVRYGNDTVNGRNAFGVEWPGVGYFSNHTNKLNTFELVIIDRSDLGAGNFDFEFNYDSIQWETGDADDGSNGLGGTVVHAGYSNGLAGAANVSYEFPGSGITGRFLDGGANALNSHSLNSNVAGRYLFTTRGGVVSGESSAPAGAPATTTPVLILSGVMLIGIVAFLKTRIA
jgi:hypothetical protein